ncbi:MAG TPA: hypothetical protein DEB55_16200 [Microbacterium sp.]|uniref:tubulin-like doman-containing protein n=1 Tax=Microbacterium sp. UBA1612 TaxID=1946942 RepID=UPI000E870B14|nr:tubulin-like doman-containing protein [Microbacterium sp. UBA1612]HBS75905.1 hypothetical protein [Microbacterium sp.]|tara:strand:+ start:3690 stop:7094 length:3405 start_codon:yes stop_codon:yes gene_type:complete
MLRPFLIVGVGGSGGKTIRGLRHALTLRLEQAGWRGGLPTAWQLIHFDTPVAQDGADYGLPFLPATDYKGMVASGGSYETVFQAIMHGQQIASGHRGEAERMLPDPSRVPVDVTKGAGQFRGVGRAVALSKLDEIAKVAKTAIDRMNDASALAELASLGEHLGAKQDGGATASPTGIVISSIAGGSGAGQYLDVLEAVKASAKPSTWAEQFFALLYAPDVFDNIPGAGGIPANALATVVETANGFWTREPSAATRELFRRVGLSPSYGGARDRVGAAFPLIVGRQNSRVAFSTQGEVYSAVSASVAAWMTDDLVQGNLDDYATTNWYVNVGANELADATRLMRSLDQAPPFGAMGFGRVTLGREKFVDYASERFARSVIDRMLFAHTEKDPRFEERTEEEWIEYRKSQVLDAFIRAVKLDEETEERNDVIDAIRPLAERDALGEELRHTVLSRAQEGLDKTGGLDRSTWSTRLLNLRDELVPSYLARDTTNRSENFDEWLATMPDHIIDTLEWWIAEHGLPVTVALLRELSRVLRSASEGLKDEAQTHLNWTLRVHSLVEEHLAEAANQDSIRPDQDVIELALDRVVQSFEWQSEANLRLAASGLLAELRSDFIDPLRETLDSARMSLRQEIDSRTLRDGRENDYAFWPKFGDPSVPRKYTPAPNERLLVSHEAYPTEFNRLVEATFGKKKFDDAMREAIGELVRGPSAAEQPEASLRWSAVEMPRGWIPAATADPDRRAAKTSAPRFTFDDDPQEYLTRAKRWMLRKGRAFDSYIGATLTDFFDIDQVKPDELRRRREAFREGLTAALGASEPLVRLNPGLLSTVHGKSIDKSFEPTVSAIPFKTGTDMYEITKSALVAAGVWDESKSPKWFRDANVDAVEIFAMSSFPCQPVVIDSVMAPIAKGWLADSGTSVSRAAFWKWKRARLLRESTPAAPEVFDAMLRGWYVAKALGQLDMEATDREKGPKLKIWDAERRGYVDFPHPLLYPGIAPPVDFPGAVMESLIIAQPLANAAGSLEPLRPYHVLLDLGGDGSEPGHVLADWISYGTMPDASPIPDPARAGTPSQTMRERQEAVRAFIDVEIDAFTSGVIKQDPETRVLAYPVTWEIRDTVLTCLRDIRDGVLRAAAPTSGI